MDLKRIFLIVFVAHFTMKISAQKIPTKKLEKPKFTYDDAKKDVPPNVIWLAIEVVSQEKNKYNCNEQKVAAVLATPIKIIASGSSVLKMPKLHVPFCFITKQKLGLVKKEIQYVYVREKLCMDTQKTSFEIIGKAPKA